MTHADLSRDWNDLVAHQRLCRRCMEGFDGSLIHEGSRPLLGQFKPWARGLLFVFEAPNRADTFDQDKGYLTYNRETDLSGRFARQLMTEELKLDPAFFQVTNSVLCLPRRKGGKYPVTGSQRKLCASVLNEQIEMLGPLVVVAVGRAAVNALSRIAPHPFKKIADAVARPVPWDNRWLFPVYHTSMQARNGRYGREPEDQRSDWRRLREFALEKGVVFPISLGETYRSCAEKTRVQLLSPST